MKTRVGLRQCVVATAMRPFLYRVILAHGVRNLLSPGLEPRAPPSSRQEHTVDDGPSVGAHTDMRWMNGTPHWTSIMGSTGHPCPSLMPIFFKPRGGSRGAHRATVVRGPWSMVTRRDHSATTLPARFCLPALLNLFSDLFFGPVLCGLALRPAA